MKPDRVKILVVEPLRQPYTKVVENSLYTFQKIVGGFIEAVPVPDESGVVIICNEEGKLEGLPCNRKFYNDILVGTFFICRADDEGEMISLTDEDIKKYTEMFSLSNKEFHPVIGYIDF